MKKWIFVGILILGFLLRIIGLANHPAGFTPDEASFGYDAYSILKTGKDQWGHTMPLVFKSFGDDKLPVYTYLAVPSVAAFGVNETAVRLPNAILGSLGIVVVYLLVKELFDREDLALVSSFLLAISPWHVMLSRGAFEANLTTFFLPLGILFFLKSVKNSKFLFLSFLVFLVNIFTYHTARILTPLILFFLIFIYKDNLQKIKSLKIWTVLAGVLLAISLAGILFGGSRLSSSGIFNDVNTDIQYFSVRVGEPSIIAKVFNNKFLIVSETAFKNYVSYFSPQFLFTNGPNEGTYGMVPGVGVLYLVEVVFLLGFLVKTVKERNTKETLLLIFWILISPLPASLTKGPGLAANRAAFMMPAIQIMSAIGAIYLYELVNKRFKKVFRVTTGAVFVVLFCFFLNDYFVKQPALYAKDMVYGAKEVFEFLDKNNPSLEDMVMVTKKISEPHIYAAFYTKMDPRKYQEESKNWKLINGWVDQMPEYSLGKYTFSDNYNLPTWTVVVPPEEVPATVCSSQIIKKIYLPSGKDLFYIRQNGISVSHGC